MKLLLISPSTVYATQRLQQEAILQHIALTTVDARSLAWQASAIDPQDFDVLFIRQAYPEFELIIKLAKQFAALGKVVIDQSIAKGELEQDKRPDLVRLAQKGITTPQFVSGEKYPLVAKWIYGFGGQHIHWLQSAADLEKIKRLYPPQEVILQEFIPAEWEYKVITVGYRSLPVILKIKTPYRKLLPDLRDYQVLALKDTFPVAELAEQSSQVLERELAKTDILEAGGQLYVLEVNRWPGFRYFEQASGYNVAREFLRYIKKQHDQKN